jgi:hypothetical protein
MRKSLAVLLAFPALAAANALAVPERLDDSASPRSRIEVSSRWQYEGEGLGGTQRIHAMVAEVPNLEVRLNTARFAGRKGRIYLVVPPFVPGLRGSTGMRVEWRTRGPLLAGAGLPGARTLVYEGPVPRPVLADVLDLTLYLDARFVDRGVRFEPYFEIEIAP